MMPPPMTTARAVSVTSRDSPAPDRYRPPSRPGRGRPPRLTRAADGDRGDRSGLALAEPHRDAELLEILVEDFPPSSIP